MRATVRHGRGRGIIVGRDPLQAGEAADGEPTARTRPCPDPMLPAPHASIAPPGFSATVAPPEDALRRVRRLATDEATPLVDGGPLHEAVAEVVRRARAVGCAPERTLVALTLCAPPHAGYASPERSRSLRTAIVRWTIESYFEMR